MTLFDLTNQQWTDLIISIVIVVVAVLLTRPLLNLLLGQFLKRLTRNTKTTLDDVLIEAVRPPLFWLILTSAFLFAIDRLDFIVYPDGFPLEDIRFSLYFLLSTFALIRLTNSFLGWYIDEIAPKTESNLDEQLLPFFRRIATIIMVIIAGIILLGRFNIEVSGLVATLGIGSLAIALAAQSTLSDTISGFMIMLDRPFRIGDRVEIQELDTWGDVVDVGLRSTHIRTNDNRTAIIPNSIIAKSLIVNHSYPDSLYRIQIEIGIAYGSDLELARKTIIEAVRKVEGVLPDKPVEALFLVFADSALTFRVRWWIDSYLDTRRMFDKVNTAMYNALNQAKIEIAFPQMSVHHKLGEKEFKQIERIVRE